MADFNSIEILGTVNSPAAYQKDGTAVFNLLYRGGVKPMNYIIATNLRYLIEKTIQPYIIAENLGKRVMIVGSIIDYNIIAPTRIYFIDSFYLLNKQQLKRNRKSTFQTIKRKGGNKRL